MMSLAWRQLRDRAKSKARSNTVLLASTPPLLEHYVEKLRALLGPRFDRATFDRSWNLCWLKVFVQLGYCLIDPLVGKHT